MILQITNYGVGVLALDQAPVLDLFTIGSGYNYVPVPTDTNIHGQPLFTGVVSAPLIINANVVKYTVSMDTSVGDFDWGEVGFFYQGQLFALAVGNSLQEKRKVGVDTGNQVRLDAFLTIVGDNYSMIVDQADSSNQFQVASLSTLDQLPPTNQTTPNAYVISPQGANQTAFLAYTDRVGLWNFDAYQFSSSAQVTVVAADAQSVTIAATDYTPGMAPSYFGKTVVEFATGQLYSICRYVKTAVQGAQGVTLGFQTPMAVVPNVGDKIIVFTRNANSAALEIPIATAAVLGGIKIGQGLIVAADGTCSVDAATLGAVTSVNGKGPGIVTLTPDDIPGLATVAKTGNYNDLLNLPPPYSLPVATATVLGGVKSLVGSVVTISPQGVIDLSYRPVKSVNNVLPDANGNVTISANPIGLVNPLLIASGSDLNTFNVTGLFDSPSGTTASLLNAPLGITGDATLEVVPANTTGTGLSIQRMSTDTGMWWRRGTGTTWSAWVQVSTTNIATTTSLGVVKIGQNLTIAGDGTLSANNQTTPAATSSTIGSVKPGTGLQVAADGTLSLNNNGLPIATTTTTGVVKVGTGLQVAGDGTLSINPNALPVATGSVPGVVKPGTGLTVGPDGSLNVTPQTIPIATTTTLGGVIIGSGLTVTGTGLISANLRTVNGVTPDASGNVAVASDSNKLDKVNGVATGLFLTFLDQGTKASGAAVTVSALTANVQRMQFVGGASTWSMVWPALGVYAEVQVEVQNGGLATHTWPAAVHWYNTSDGTTTTSFTTYIGNKRSGATNLQSAGIDFLIFWTRDGGATIYGMVL